MTVKMILTDLDGTLLDENRQIRQEGIEAIQRWKAAGGIFSFITGRPAFGVLSYGAQAGINGPLVCCNGAELAEAVLWDGTGTAPEISVIRRLGMKLSGLRLLMEAASKAGVTVLCYQNGEEYAMDLTEWVKVRRARGRSYPLASRDETFWQGEAQKVNIMADGEKEQVLKLRPLMEAAKGSYQVILYGDGGCEIIPGGCSKAEGMRELAGRMGISPSQIMVLGDNANDVEMLKAAGIGVAVANGTQEAKACADYVCREAYTLGVAEAIDKLMAGELERV